jgi:hypothetical protein
MSEFKKTGVGFEFNPLTHRYYLDGVAMTGVTTILGVIAKPQLIKWASDQAVDYIDENLFKTEKNVVDLGEEADCKWVEEKLAEARKAYATKRDKAADLGTAVHAEVEEYIKCKISGIDWFTDNPQVQHFIDWADKHKVEFIASEEQVYSKTLFVAGTYDFACIIDGRKYLGDLKTANALYPEYFYQCAAYRMMCEEMGQTDFKGSILVRIGRDGKFNEDQDVIISESYEDEKEAFLSAHKLYRITQQYDTKRKGSSAL